MAGQPLLSLSAASLLLAVLAAVLAYYNGRPAPSMQSDLNVSALVTLFCVLAIVLLGHSVVMVIQPNTWSRTTQRKGMQMVLAGLLMLAILSVGPAAQYIVQYSSTSYAVGTAKIPLSTAFAAFEKYPDNAWATFLSITAVNAIYNGFFGKPAPFDTVCPSGNCTWDKPYTTLALCSSCTDLTSSLTPYTDDNGQEVGIQLPNGFFLRYNGEHQLPMGQRQFYDNMNSTGKRADVYKNLHFFEYDSIAYQGLPGKFQTLFTIVGSTPEAAPYMSEAPEPAAYECVLQWCLQQSTAKMVNGQLNETAVKVINDTTVDVPDAMSILSRQLTDPATKQIYNVTKHSEYSLSNVLVNLINGTRNANVSGDAVPLTSLWDALVRQPEKTPAVLYSHLAYSLSTFMRVNNSAILLANYSSAEGVATSDLEIVLVSWEYLAWTALVVAMCGLFAFTLKQETNLELDDDLFTPLSYSDHKEAS